MTLLDSGQIRRSGYEIEIVMFRSWAGVRPVGPSRVMYTLLRLSERSKMRFKCRLTFDCRWFNYTWSGSYHFSRQTATPSSDEPMMSPNSTPRLITATTPANQQVRTGKKLSVYPIEYYLHEISKWQCGIQSCVLRVSSEYLKFNFRFHQSQLTSKTVDGLSGRS